MSLILFDIDGTLLMTGGAGVRAMSRAFQEVFDVADAFAGIDVAGRTDTYIVSTAFARAGVPESVEARATFHRAYLRCLDEELPHPVDGRHGLLPGVAALLEHLVGRDEYHLALLTGNFEAAAFAKLNHFGIGRYFAWGAFGEESADRDDIARAALGYGRARGLPPPVLQRAIVIGDTPHDITCARAIGARVLAVATGRYSVAALSAEQPDAVFADLSDVSAVLQVIDGDNRVQS